MEIWDIHCHLPSGRVRGDNLSDDLSRMLEIADRVGIDKIGAFLGGDPEDSQRNKEVIKAVEKHHPRVLGFIYCSLPKVQESIDKLNRFVADGPFVGLKLGGGSGIASKPEYDPVFQRAVELDTIIYQHTWIKLGGDPPRPGGGNLPRESTPADAVEVAKRYDYYPIICGHTGGDWELGIRTVGQIPNMPVEIGGGYPNRGMVEMAVRDLGPERVIYGSDVTGRSFASQLGKVWGADISDREKQLIFSGNIRRIGEKILKRKGLYGTMEG